MFFSKEERLSVVEANPTWKVPDVGRELGARWANCQDKSKYEAMAAKDKKRYESGKVTAGALHSDDFFDVTSQTTSQILR